ncbi:MAG: IS66 family transposase [Planctomycetaceae bacterium]|nr:IS66 family transposase [Planctomycetaceae bacterium]
MIEKEQNMSREQLLDVILDLKKKAAEEEAYRAENSLALTAMAKEYQALVSQRDALQAEVANLKKVISHISDVSRQRANEIFGRSTEKLSDILSDTPCREDVDEAPKEPTAPASPGPTVPRKNSLGGRHTGGKNKKAGKREEDFSRLPQRTSFLLDAAALDSQYGEGNWRISFWHRHQTLEKCRPTVYVQNTYTPVISVGLEHVLTTLPYEAPLWQRSFASPSILAEILYQKFSLSLPLNRQEMLYSDSGAALSRQTMCHWATRAAFDFFQPVCDYLVLRQLKVPYHQCDETTLLVNRDGRSAGTKSYVWVHTTSELAESAPIIVFCYELTRGTEHLRKYYEDFKGFITCDAYCSYQVLEKEKQGVIAICGCMMHMRRRFAESLSLVDKSSLGEEAIAELPEVKALLLIGRIYDADEPLKTLSAGERLAKRQETVKPLVEEYFQYIEGLDTEDPLMGEKLKDAVNYSKNQKEYLCRFLTDGHIPCDNGFCERSLRILTIGRKNFLFCDSVDGAKAAAVMYSIVGTARANKVNVYWYLRYILENIPKHADIAKTSKFLETMMPWSSEYREYERLRVSQVMGPPGLEPNEYSDRPRTPRKKKMESVDNEAAKSA